MFKLFNMKLELLQDYINSEFRNLTFVRLILSKITELTSVILKKQELVIVSPSIFTPRAAKMSKFFKSNENQSMLSPTKVTFIKQNYLILLDRLTVKGAEAFEKLNMKSFI